MNKLLLISTFYFLLAAFNSIAQPTIEWEKSYGGSGFELLYSMQSTSDGGYILAGSSVSNDGDLTNNKGAGDYWIVKIDSVGTLQWQKSYGGSENDEALSVKQTTDGGYIVAGMSKSIDGDINDHQGSITDYDYWVLRLDSSGNIIWKKSYGGFADDKAYAVQQTTDGGFIVAGESSGDYWIVKLNVLGSVQWNKFLGGSDFDKAYSVQQTIDGGYILSGSSKSNDGDISANKGGDDYWIVKLNALGDIQWEKSYGGTDHDFLPSIKSTNDGSFMIYGISRSNDGDVNNNVNNSGGIWVVKINSIGNILWERFIDSVGVAGILQWTVNDALYISNGNALLAGVENSTTSKFWVGAINNSGTLIWNKTMGGSNIDEARAVVQNSDGSYLLAGHSYSFDGDVSLNKGMSDFWVVKLSSTVGIDEVENNSSIIIFPNPTNAIFTINSNEQIDEVEIFNTQGQAVYNKKTTSNSSTIDLTSLPKGIYLVQLKTNTNSVTKKIVYE